MAKYIERVEKATGYKFDLDSAKMYEPVGCEACSDLGYFERIGAFEVLYVDEYLKEMISSGKSSIEIMKYAIEETEYKPLIVDAVRKALEGITTLEEVQKKMSI